MSLKLMYITNDSVIAEIAEKNGVDRIWIDLEWMGKEKRQPGMNTVKSNHTIDDVEKLRPHIKKSELLVRVNPLFQGSKKEIDAVIKGGADIVMLPMFKTVNDVKAFVDMVDRRAKVMLLVETPEAICDLREIIKVPGIDEIHIGLNDLHIAYGMSFMFELLTNGVVEDACKIIKESGVPFGFGGMARLGEGTLPAEYIIGEHYRMGSSGVILSRTFCDTWTYRDYEQITEIFESEVKKIRDYEKFLKKQNEQFFLENHERTKNAVSNIVENMNKRTGGN